MKAVISYQRPGGVARLFPSAIWLWVVGCALLFSISACNMERAEAIREMNQGLDHYERGQSPQAIKLLEQAAQTDPSYSEPVYYLGQLFHMRFREYDRAEHYYRQALERDKRNPQYAYRLGTVLAEQDKHDEAIRVLRSAVERKPNYARAWYRLGQSQQAKQQYLYAIESFSRSIHVNPRMRFEKSDPGGEAYYALGDLYTRYGLYDHSLKVFENGILNNPDAPRLFHGRGIAQLELKRYSEAARSFEQALEIDPGFGPALFSLAVARQADGLAEQAIQALERFMNTARSGDDVRVMAANALLRQLRDKVTQ